ncbi:DUF881 domain-containing protein [Halocella sp. SP3-1]|uniref:DUF881 domain-containing protein n=1 Tax=Halocella sp. SP3-1 TaxID=2382161 RepID=UPI000F74DC05|nr:DUF881 domain-containing protein [Halocella sp. SP3-1]AZO95019.1 DUF881 domain-containing protein [Halocella sp. SP3-1]MTI61293.1 DUF881 domain-containing protein [Bacillota bacterium]
MLKKSGYILYTAVILIILLNIILFLRILGVFYFPGEITPLDRASQGAQSVIEYSEELAKSYGVDEQKSVTDILARFKYEVEKANNAEELASLMVDYGRQTQDIIFRELQQKRIDKVFKIINSQNLPKKGKITIARTAEQLKILDPDQILTNKTREKLEGLTFNQTIEIQIKDGRASLVSTGDFFNQVDFLQTKLASLERQLKLISQKAGYEPLNGKGIIINVYDKDNNLEKMGIVHDADIRNIINELVIAGARGIEVGGQRLTVHSAIRCVGPTILVNNKPISVNPIIIKAVGEPRTLASSLDIVRKQLENFGIEIEVVAEDNIRLNGQKNYER